MTKTKPELFSVDYEPWKKGDYLRAMIALAGQLEPHQENPHFGYTILHKRGFDPVDRRWRYQLRAIPTDRGIE